MYGPIELTTLNGPQEEKDSKPTYMGSLSGVELESFHWILYRFHAEFELSASLGKAIHYLRCNPRDFDNHLLKRILSER